MSEALCQEFCDAAGPQCTAVMRTPADGQCYFRSSGGVQPLVDWADSNGNLILNDGPATRQARGSRSPPPT